MKSTVGGEEERRGRAIDTPADGDEVVPRKSNPSTQSACDGDEVVARRSNPSEHSASGVRVSQTRAVRHRRRSQLPLVSSG